MLDLLPSAAGPFQRILESRRVLPAGIFDYMDGAGELYLAYRLRALDVVEFRAPREEPILVELYSLENSDDAFGLLSQDWGGTPLVSTPSSSPSLAQDNEPFPRGLYGEGLLRLRFGNHFARILAQRETPSAREAVLAIGRSLLAKAAGPATPRLVQLIPTQLAGWTHQNEHLLFLRSHLVLNSAFFLGSQNLLGLGPEVSAVTTLFRAEGIESRSRSLRIIIVEYPSPRAAGEARSAFSRSFFPEQPPEPTVGSREPVGPLGEKHRAGVQAAEFPTHATGPGPIQGKGKAEDGWVGWRQEGVFLVLAFQCPDSKTADAVLNGLSTRLTDGGHARD